MKIFKNILIIIALCAPNFMFAAFGTKPGTIKPGALSTIEQPVITPPAQEGAVAKKTFAQLVNDVKTARDAWNNATDNSKKMLSAPFVERIGSAAKIADLNDYQFDTLLQMARDYHAIFTGNSEQDKIILNNLAQQRKNLIAGFNE